jgi:hypothetical protein
MTPMIRWLLPLLLAGGGLGPVQASAIQGEEAARSKASISISISVAPRFAVHAAEGVDGTARFGRSAASLQCLQSNLPAGFTILMQGADGAIGPQPAPGQAAQGGAQEAGHEPCARPDEYPATTVRRGAIGAPAGEPASAGPVTLLIHPE